MDSRTRTASPAADDRGFTLVEMLIALAILTVVSGTVMKGVMAMTDTSRMVSNRTDMHNGVRNATELLTQEVGQAGRISLPGTVALTADAPAGTLVLQVGSTAADGDTPATAGMFNQMLLLIGTGDTQETVTVAAVGTDSVTLMAPGVKNDHIGAVPVQAVGGFAEGVIPPADQGYVNGSTATILKIFGDIHGTGEMVYVEYTCDIPNGRLYRNSVPYTATSKGSPSVEEILIDNIEANPPDEDGNATPCFTYQTETVVGRRYVVDVAITLTVHTQNRDKFTADFQRETKALLNVSPRNVFNVWQAASLNITDRIQPIPPSVALLLPSVTSPSYQ